MKYKIFSLDEDGRISFTKEELEKLLDEVYNDGYEQGSKRYVYCYPTTYTEPYITYSSQSQNINTITTATNSEHATPTINTKGE